MAAGGAVPRLPRASLPAVRARAGRRHSPARSDRDEQDAAAPDRGRLRGRRRSASSPARRCRWSRTTRFSRRPRRAGSEGSPWYNTGMSAHDVDGLNTGYARALLDDYLENPAAVPPEWRELFESGDSDLLATHPGVARLLEAAAHRSENGHANGHAVAPVAPRPGAPVAGRRAAARRAAAEPPRRRPADRPPAAGRRRRRDGARQGAPNPRPSRGASRPARIGAGGRPVARAAAARAEADAGAAGAHPGLGAARRGARRHARRRAAAARRDLLRDDGVRDRAALRPRAAGVAAPGDRVGALPPADERRRPPPPLPPAVRGRGDGAVPAQALPRPEAVLARRAST